MLSTILAVAGLLLLLLFILLAIPVSLSYQLNWDQTIQGRLRLSWLSDRIRIQLPLAPKKPPKKTTKKKQYMRNKPKSTQKQTFALIRQKDLRRRGLRFIRDCWHAIHKEHIYLRVRIGLGDPADTGQLWAFIGPLAGLLANTRHAEIEVEPDFFDSIFQLDSSGNIRLIPLQIIYLTMGFLMSSPFRQAMKQSRA